MIKKYVSFLYLIVCISFNGCKEKEPDPLQIITQQVTQITESQAKSGGYISSGNANSYGVCWSLNQSPTVKDNLTNDGSGTGLFSSLLTDLNPATKYYVRAYASNEKETVYGDEETFSSLGQAPTVVTTAASLVGSLTALLNGIVNCNYLSTTVTFEYGHDTNYGKSVPFQNNPAEGSVETSVNAPVSGLDENSIYHYRIRARNTLGEVFGNDIVFKTFPLNGTKDTLKDIDGNIYETVVINTQIWMTENLKVEHLNDGVIIPYVTDPYQWESSSNPCYSWHNNDTANKEDGALYNWYTVGTGRICPAGWHVPNEQEWKELGLRDFFEVFGGYNLEEAFCGYRSCDFWWASNLYYGAWISAGAVYISRYPYELIYYSNYRERRYHIRCLKDEFRSEN